MLLDLFIITMCLAVLMTFYAWLFKDNENYTHILSGFTAGILYLILGFDMFGGVTYDYVMLNNSTSTIETVQYAQGSISLFLVIFGGIMILYSIVNAVDVVRDVSGKL